MYDSMPSDTAATTLTGSAESDESRESPVLQKGELEGYFL